METGVAWGAALPEWAHRGNAFLRGEFRRPNKQKVATTPLGVMATFVAMPALPLGYAVQA
ncbi:hypothetical protein ACFRAU_19335 [Arthrobacter sp. NPDC056691]|uniref:hypothetical protein n=1 Tax=Arthrobacter sp. NPDC056691 TaxID=3345913 RepID=UPI00366E6FB3